jgi:hypothetical protein
MKGARVVAAEPTARRLFDLTGKVSPVTGAGHHGVMLDQMEPASLEAGFAGAVAAIGRSTSWSTMAMRRCRKTVLT